MSNVLKEIANRARNSIMETSTGYSSKYNNTNIINNKDKLVEFLSSRSVVNALSVLVKNSEGIIRCRQVDVRDVQVIKGVDIQCDCIDAYDISVETSDNVNVDIIILYIANAEYTKVFDCKNILDRLSINKSVTVLLLVLLDEGSSCDKEYIAKLKSEYNEELRYGKYTILDVFTNNVDDSFVFHNILEDLFTLCRCSHTSKNTDNIEFKSPEFIDYRNKYRALSAYRYVNGIETLTEKDGNSIKLNKFVSTDRRPLIDILNETVNDNNLFDLLSNKATLMAILEANFYGVIGIDFDYNTMKVIYNNRVTTNLLSGAVLDAFNFTVRDVNGRKINICIFYTTGCMLEADEIFTEMLKLGLDKVVNLFMLGLFDTEKNEEYISRDVSDKVRSKYCIYGNVSCILRTSRHDSSYMLQHNVNTLFEIFRKEHRK